MLRLPHSSSPGDPRNDSLAPADNESGREANLRALFTDAPIGMAVTSVDGVLLAVNQSLADILGYLPGDLVGLTLTDISHPDDLPEHIRRRAELAEGVAARYAMDKRYVAKDGSIVWTRLSGSLIRDDEGAPLQYISQIQDISEERRLMEQLAESNMQLAAARDEALGTAAELAQQANRLEALFTDAPIGMAVTSPGGALLQVNSALAGILGYSEAELLGMTLSDISYADDLPEHLAHRQALVDRSDTAYQMDKRHVHKDGRIVWTKLSGSLIWGADGQPLHFISQIQDISAERRLVDQLAQSNEDLSRFAYIASHDLQAPLRSVKGFSELLISTFPEGSLNEEQTTMAVYIDRGISQMQRLIVDLLDYSRIESEANPVETVAIADVVADVAAVLSGQIAEESAKIICDSADTVTGDAGQLRQALQNLMGNALTHRSPDRSPVVTITSRHRQGGWIEVTVADNGPGIDEKEFPRIFEMFQQLEAGKGTGIGLAVVKRVIERHGGSITVESDGRTGASFIFTLPEAGPLSVA